MIDMKMELFFSYFKIKNPFIALATELFLTEEEGKKKQFSSFILKCFWCFNTYK